MKGVAFGFHYINRMAHVFLSDSPLPAVLGGFRRSPVTLRIGGSVFGRAIMKRSTVPDELYWASRDAAIAGAVSRMAQTTQSHADNILSERLQRFIKDYLNGWDLTPLPLGQGWLSKAMSGIPHTERFAARFLLLTACASYRVTDEDVAAFRAFDPRDASLLAAAAWASLQAAQRIMRS